MQGIGVSGPTRLTANEVAIGLTLPRSADVILRQRLTPAAFQRASLLAVAFDPDAAVQAGALDEVVDEAAFGQRVDEVARMLTQLDIAAQRATKARVRAHLHGELAAAISLDRAEFESQLVGVGAGD
jgi:enoyl-CoA hydratase